MKPIRSEELARLMQGAIAPAITLYMPTIKAGRETRQNAIRFRNLLRDVETELDARFDLDPETRAELLAPLSALRDDNEFWQHQEEGLVIFRDREQFSPHPVQETVPESVHVGKTFAIKRILPLLHEHGRFQIVVFGKESVQLYMGTRHGLRPVLLPEDCPASLQDALGHELTEPHLNHHGGHGGGERGSVWHGQGSGENKEDGEWYKYAGMVAQSLAAAMAPNAPIVLAGTEKPVAYLREASGWKHIVEGRIAGAPETRELDEAKLHREGWRMVEPLLMARINGDLSDLAGLESRSLATHDLRAAIDAVKQSRVKTLYLTADASQWGDYEAGRGRVRIDRERLDDSIDLIEMLARETWQQGGEVIAVAEEELPCKHGFAVVYRY